MEVTSTFEIGRFKELECGSVFIAQVGEATKYCIKSFLGERNDPDILFAVIATIDDNVTSFNFIVDDGSLANNRVLEVKDCKLQLPELAETYSLKQGYSLEPGKVFIFEEGHFLGVRSARSEGSWLLNLESGELLAAPPPGDPVIVRKWKLVPPVGTSKDELLGLLDYSSNS